MVKYVYAVGKRKTATAQVKLFEWVWEDKVNWKKVNEYVKRSDLFDVLYTPLKLTKMKDKVHFDVEVDGSGESAQVQAIRHWLSKALSTKEASARPVLKSVWLLTRDSRVVERKKPGKKKARKSPSWSKR